MSNPSETMKTTTNTAARATLETVPNGKGGYQKFARWMGVTWKFVGRNAPEWIARNAPNARTLSVAMLDNSTVWTRTSRNA